jgi:hypothetical protein
MEKVVLVDSQTCGDMEVRVVTVEKWFSNLTKKEFKEKYPHKWDDLVQKSLKLLVEQMSDFENIESNICLAIISNIIEDNKSWKFTN